MSNQNNLTPPTHWIRDGIRHLKEYVFVDDVEYELLIFTSINTYIYKNMPAVPYLLLLAPPDSGKTNTLIVLSYLVYKPTLAFHSSSAGMRRVIRNLKGTFIMDEWLNKKNKVLEDIFRSGYKKRGGKFYIGDIHNQKKVRTYNSYCPKVVASTEQIHDPALRTRFIPINMRKSPVPLKQPNGEWKEVARQIKSHIVSFVRENRQRIIDEYYSLQPHRIPPGRIVELWKPILSISKVADDLYSNNQEVFYNHMLDLAKAQAEKAKIDTIVENPDLYFTTLLSQYISQYRPDKEDYYRLDKIKHFLVQQDKFKFLHWHQEYISLRLNRLNLILDLKRYRFVEGRTGEERIVQRTCILIDSEKLSQIVSRFSL